MSNKLQIQMLGLPRSGTYFLQELVEQNAIDDSLNFFGDHDPCKHLVYLPSIQHYLHHFNNINIILLIFKDIATWIESNLVRWQDFDIRIFGDNIIDVCEPTVPELTIENNDVFGHVIPTRKYNLAKVVEVYNLFHYNWLVKNYFFNMVSDYKQKLVVVPYEDLLIEENVYKLFNVLKPLGLQTKTDEYKVPKMGTVNLSRRDYPLDHLEKYKNRQTSVLTEYQKQFVYDNLNKDVKTVFTNINNFQIV